MAVKSLNQQKEMSQVWCQSDQAVEQTVSVTVIGG